MNIDPGMEQFGKIMESTPESEELFKKLLEEGQIIATSDSKDQLKKLQDDLRKVGYRQQFNTGPLHG